MEPNQSQDWLELHRPDRPDPDLPSPAEPHSAGSLSPDDRQRLTRIVAADEKIGAHVRDVPVPADLKAKVLDRLYAQRQTRRQVTRWIFAATVGTAAAAALAAIYWPIPQRVLSLDEVGLEAMDLWNLPVGTPTLENCSIQEDWPDAFRAGDVRGCQPARFAGTKTVVYQLLRGNSWAIVCKVPRSALPDDLPAKYSTRGLTVYFLADATHVAVAVLQDGDDIQHFLVRKPLT